MIKKTRTKFANKAYRTILVAYKDISMKEFKKLKKDNNNFENVENKEAIETDLIAIGIFGIEDPLREGIRESVQ